MKFLFLLCLVLSFNVQAKSERKKMTLDEKKQKVLGRMSARVNIINEAKTCVQNSQSKEELKDCRKDLKAKVSSLRDQYKRKK